jgi:TonB family protein
MVVTHDAPVTYALPLVLALLVHVGVLALLWFNWTPSIDTSRVIRPEIVKAELIVMQPQTVPAKPPPKPVVQPKPAPPKPQPTPPKPAPVPPKPAPTPSKVEPKPAPTPARDPAADRRAAEEARRAAELNRLATTAFDDALAREAESLAKNTDAEAVMSYEQGIYRLIVGNWSRPPSARNDMRAILMVELVPTGDVVGVSLLQSSGNEAFDRSAEQAVRKAAKFDVPKEPDLFEKYFRRFQLVFKPEDLLR